jgi:hypothetical protein
LEVHQPLPLPFTIAEYDLKKDSHRLCIKLIFASLEIRNVESAIRTKIFNTENLKSPISDGTDTWSFVYNGDSNHIIQSNPDAMTTLFLFGELYEVNLIASEGSTSSINRLIRNLALTSLIPNDRYV